MRTTVRALMVSEVLKAWPTTMREIIEDGAEDGFGRVRGGGADLGAMHEVADPEIIDVVHFVGLADIGALLPGEPPWFLTTRSKVL